MIQSNYVRAPARPACRSGHTTRRGASRSRVCRRVGFHVGHLWSFGVRRSATPFPSAPFVCRRDAVALLSVSARSRHHLPVLVYDNEFDGITWHTCLCHVGGDTIKCGKRLSDSLVLALHRALSSLVGPPRLHHAKIHSGLRNLLLGSVAVMLDLSPDVSATIASVELDWQVRWAFE